MTSEATAAVAEDRSAVWGDPAPSRIADPDHVLQCIEVWGGNERADEALAVPGLDLWVFSEPVGREASGGDLHYVSMCGAGHVVRLMLADVAGHGDRVGPLARRFRKLLRKNINILDQTRIARTLNHELAIDDAGADFATAFIATYYGPTDHLLFCNAGHPRPLWYRSATRQWTCVEAEESKADGLPSNLPLGVIDETPYEQQAIQLAPGDVIVLFTDSLIEAANPDGRQLGEQGLLELARTLSADEPESLHEKLVAAVAAWRHGAPSDDDVTVMVMHHNGAKPPRQSFVDRMRVLVRMMGAA